MEKGGFNQNQNEGEKVVKKVKTVRRIRKENI